ncbi:hypothetical protein BJY28_001939 [Janibacter alkaliphilus]|uniref:Uncharacterized protein n=1 Tax=Janibacter alkaliphilus TaxID=1069963 RepID=A0A852X7M8_9MICO|nr:hypothetical protein [Janibacter alkaliphilus]
MGVMPLQGVDHILHVVVGSAALVIGHVMCPRGRARSEPERLWARPRAEARLVVGPRPCAPDERSTPHMARSDPLGHSQRDRTAPTRAACSSWLAAM